LDGYTEKDTDGQLQTGIKTTTREICIGENKHKENQSLRPGELAEETKNKVTNRK
jgi:hypothetical protein